MGKESIIHLRFAAASDVGRVRTNNEDAYLAEPELGLFAVADGMGGHASGEVASALAVQALREVLSRAAEKNESSLSEDRTAVLSLPANLLVGAIRLANQKIYQASRLKDEYKGMGTTLVALYFSGPAAISGNVGDSRMYRLRGKRIEQITEDHSVVWEQYKKGLLPKEALAASAYKNVITRALGTQPSVDVDVQDLKVERGDLFLLCSDGLSDLVPDEEMLDTVRGAASLEAACRDLISLANARGGKDNITVVLVGKE